MKIVTLSEAAELLKQGKVGVIPTDTVYGLAAKASDKGVVARFYNLKNRTFKPGTVIAAKIEDLKELGVDKDQLEKREVFWPNPISIETPLQSNLAYLHQNTGRQAFRVVADKKLSKFLTQTGPLVTTSANKPGEPAAEDLQQAINYFGDEVDFYVDAGDLSNREPSTIIGLDGDEIIIYREGAVKKAELERLKNANS